MSQAMSPEKNLWGWKGTIIATVISILFLGVFYLAMSNEPDYMPSQQQKATQQHAFKTAPAMSPEALAEAEKNRQAREANAAPATATATATATEHQH